MATILVVWWSGVTGHAIAAGVTGHAIAAGFHFAAGVGEKPAPWCIE